MIIQNLITLISKSPRATEQELLDEAHKVDGIFTSLKRVHDSTNLALKDKIDLISKLELVNKQFDLEKKNWLESEKALKSTIAMLAQNSSSGGTS